MMTVNEVSKISGVSIRTLHYYDEIDLLKPVKITESGYRMYDDTSLEKLQLILLFRELQFPLKEIKRITENPDFDRKSALCQQMDMLKLQKERITHLIDLAREMIEQDGGTKMGREKFEAFDRSKIEEYTKTAKEKWGSTTAWAEYEKKSAGRSDSEQKCLSEQLMDIFREMNAVMEKGADSKEALSMVKKLQNFITENYYTCTDEILESLGMMYAAEGEMKDNIDRARGEGTAEFAKKAIDEYILTKI